MDRNVFALIAGTVFLLFIINAVVQMQTAMVREAAQGVSNDYSEATWETAGLMHVLSHEDASSFGYFAFPDNLDDNIVEVGDACSLDDAPYFQDRGPLELGFYGSLDSVDKSGSCPGPSGYVRSAPVRVSSSDDVLYIGVERQG